MPRRPLLSYLLVTAALLPLLASCGVPDQQGAAATPVVRVVSTPVEQPLALPTPTFLPPTPEPTQALAVAPTALPTVAAADLAARAIATQTARALTGQPVPAGASAVGTVTAPAAGTATASPPAGAPVAAGGATPAPAPAAPAAPEPAAPAPAAPEPAAPAPAPAGIPSQVPAPSRTGPGDLPYPLGLSQLEFGAVQHLYWTDRGLPLEMTRQAGFSWVRQQVHWRDIEDQSGQFFWGDLDNIVNDVNAYGLKLMINVTRSPGWYTANGGDGLPQDPQTLARFLGALAERYKGRVHAILVWNEQNLAYENGGSVSEADAGHFVEIMAASYQAIKAVDPAILVVTGAPASTATDIPEIALAADRYYRAMYSYKDGMIRDYFDIQAIHPGGSANPPETLWPENPSSAEGWTEDPTFYFRCVEHYRRIMEEYGLGDHQVWVTEFGWATANSTPGYEFGNQTDFEEQRAYTVGAMQWARQHWPWASNMFLWNINFAMLRAQSGDPSHEQASFAILNADGSPRPAWYGIQEFIAQHRAGQ